jgi:Spy/CpxP family protein refolding chaperone
MTALDTARVRFRGGRWGLWASLALNVFLAAIIVAHLVAHRGPGHGAAGFGARIDRMAASLPATDGDRLRAAFTARADRVDEAVKSFRQAMAAVRRALRAEPFDPTAHRYAMAETRAKRAAIEEELQAVVAAAATEMTAEGRARLAEWPRPR